jgi:hypothetical protein
MALSFSVAELCQIAAAGASFSPWRLARRRAANQARRLTIGLRYAQASVARPAVERRWSAENLLLAASFHSLIAAYRMFCRFLRHAPSRAFMP